MCLEITSCVQVVDGKSGGVLGGDRFSQIRGWQLLFLVCKTFAPLGETLRDPFMSLLSKYANCAGLCSSSFLYESTAKKRSMMSLVLVVVPFYLLFSWRWCVRVCCMYRKWKHMYIFVRVFG